MIRTKDLYQFNVVTMDQLYDFIIEQRIKGKTNHVENMIAMLSRKQKIDALRYFYDRKNSGSVKRCMAVAFVFTLTADQLELTKLTIVESKRQMKLFESYVETG